MLMTEERDAGDELSRQDRYLKRAVIAYRVIGTALVVSILSIEVADLHPWDDRPWFWVFAITIYLGQTAGLLSALPILGLFYKRPRFVLPAALFLISALLWSVSSLIPVPAGTIPTDLSRSLESASRVSLYAAAVLAALVGWGTRLSPQD